MEGAREVRESGDDVSFKKKNKKLADRYPHFRGGTRQFPGYGSPSLGSTEIEIVIETKV